MVFKEINWDFIVVFQVGNDGGFDKGNCYGKVIYGELFEFDDFFIDLSSYLFNQY